MNVLTSLVCDRATRGPDGKLDVQGIFHDLYAPGFPAQQEKLVLVLVLEWHRSDGGPYTLRVDLLDPEGKPTLTIEGESEVEARPHDRPPARTPLVMPLDNVVFPVPGLYRFQLKVKGHTYAGPSLYLIDTEPAEN